MACARPKGTFLVNYDSHSWVGLQSDADDNLMTLLELLQRRETQCGSTARLGVWHWSSFDCLQLHFLAFLPDFIQQLVNCGWAVCPRDFVVAGHHQLGLGGNAQEFQRTAELLDFHFHVDQTAHRLLICVPGNFDSTTHDPARDQLQQSGLGAHDGLKQCLCVNVSGDFKNP